MKTAYVIAFLAAVLAVTARDPRDGCYMVKCEQVGLLENIANPLDKCSFCCCRTAEVGTSGEFRECPNHKVYDPVKKMCIDGDCKPPTSCEEIQCPLVVERFPSPEGPEYYCCCQDSATPKTWKCPNGGTFDANQSMCVGGSTRAAERLVKDGCMSLVHLCPVPEHKDRTTLFANPLDKRSYCACDWGKIHWMPCAPGTTFSDSKKVCV